MCVHLHVEKHGEETDGSKVDAGRRVLRGHSGSEGAWTSYLRLGCHVIISLIFIKIHASQIRVLGSFHQSNISKRVNLGAHLSPKHV